MIKDSENNVHIEVWDTHAIITTKQNGIGRGAKVNKEELKQVADMLCAASERMEEQE